jgi:DNA repair protein RadC
LILLNRNNATLGWYKVSQGGISGTICDPKIIFTVALQTGASSIILAHNHPSGNLTPSQSDINLTKKIKEAGKILDISVLDHLIVSSNGYKSLADDGYIL